MKKIFLFSMPITLSAALLSFSCSLNEESQIFYQIINKPNNINSYDISLNGINKKVSSDFEMLTNGFLFQNRYEGKLVYDFANQIVERPTFKYLSLQLAKSVTIETSTETKFFDNDKHEITLSRDIPQGYSKPVISYMSNDKKSINSKEFRNALKDVKNIKIDLKQKEYTKSNGNNSGFHLKAQDFYYSQKRNDLRQEKKIKKISENYSNQINKILKSKQNIFNLNDDVKYLEKEFHLESNSLLDKTNYNNKINEICFKFVKSGNAYDFLIDELTGNLLFAPISSEYILWQNKGKNIVNDYEKYAMFWYSKNLNHSLFIGDYYLNINDSNRQVFIKQNQNKKEKTMNKLVFSYLIIPLNQSIFEQTLQTMFNSKKITSVDVSQISQLQLFQTLNKKPESINYKNKKSYFKNNKKTFINLDILNINKANKYFKKLVYGNEEKIDWDYFQNSHSYEFRNNIFSVMNNFNLTKEFYEKTNWNSIFNPNLKIKPGNNNSNYKTTEDARFLINNNTFFFNGKKIFESHKEQKLENIYNKENTSFKNKYFTLIQKNIKRILNLFYKKENLTVNEKITWAIPVFSNPFKLEDKSAYQKLIDLIKKIDSRLEPYMEFSNNEQEYSKLIQSNKYFTRYIDFNTDEKVQTTLINMIFDKDINLLKYLKNKKIKSQALKILVSKIETNINNESFFKNQQIKNNILSTITNYLGKITPSEIIELLMEVDNIISKPFELQSNNDTYEFEKEIVIDGIIKPFFDKGIINYIDIKKEGE